MQRLRSPRPLAVLIAAASGLALATPTAALASSGHAPQLKSHMHNHGRDHRKHGRDHHRGNLKLSQVNLASDIPGMAPLTDPDLKNPWGISLSPTSPLWVSNQGTNSSTLFTLTPGSSTVTKVPTVRVTMGAPSRAQLARWRTRVADSS